MVQVVLICRQILCFYSSYLIPSFFLLFFLSSSFPYFLSFLPPMCFLFFLPLFPSSLSFFPLLSPFYLSLISCYSSSFLPFSFTFLYPSAMYLVPVSSLFPCQDPLLCKYFLDSGYIGDLARYPLVDSKNSKLCILYQTCGDMWVETCTGLVMDVQPK